MKNVLLFIILTFLILTGFAQAQPNDPQSLFREYWEYVDQNYIYFREKGVDWDAVYQKYSPQVQPNTTSDELFRIMDLALLELRDAHNSLFRPVKFSTPYDFDQGYDVHFDEQLVKTKYVTDSLGQAGNLYYAMLGDSVGYIRLAHFDDYTDLGNVMAIYKQRGIAKLIIDVRSNGGGDSNLVPTLLGLLVRERTRLGGYVEKNGPGHADVTAPVFVYAEPHPTFHFGIPIVVLINRQCYSATSYFAGMIKGLPGVTLMGQVTGGGGGGHLGYRLSNGWQIRVSASDFIDNAGQSIEVGVAPDVAIENTAEDLHNRRDRMLERAIQ